MTALVLYVLPTSYKLHNAVHSATISISMKQKSKASQIVKSLRLRLTQVKLDVKKSPAKMTTQSLYTSQCDVT